MSTLFQKLIAKLQKSHPVTPAIKAEAVEAVCPKCGEVFEVDVDSDSDSKDSWRTADEAGETSGDDPANTGVDDNSEEFTNMHTPRSRHDAEQIIAQSLMKVSSERTHNDPSLPSITAAKKAVEKHAKVAKQSATDLLSEAMKQAKAEQK